MIKVSVIVPVYNVEDYLERCLESLVHQTLKDIEIIAIDDGSTDRSSEILAKYKKYIKIITQKNSGVATARNSGLKVAKGEYIAFVDSDDWVSPTMYEDLYNKAKSSDYDVAICKFQYADEFKSWPGVKDINHDVLNLKDKKRYMISMYPVLWNKIYKKEKINNVRFKDGVWAEDVEFLYRALSKIDTIGFIDTFEYYYFQREKSESRLFDKRVYHYIDNFNGIIQYYKKNHIYDLYKDELEYCYVRYLYATFVKRAASFEDYGEFQEAVDEALDNVKKMFPKYRKNPYFYKSLKGIYLLMFNKIIAKMVYKISRIGGQK